MANPPKIANKRLAVLAFDGRDWFAFSFHPGQEDRFKEAGGATSVPAGVMNFLHQQRTRVVRVLLEGGVRRFETALPDKLTFAEASAMLSHEVSEQSGTEGVEWVCAGGGGGLVGASDPCMLCGAFERQQVDALHRQLTQSGLRFDGVGSLELACASFWNAHRDRSTQSLVLFSRDHGFILPARGLPDQPGPFPLSGGLRQAERAPEAWQMRFARGNRYLTKAESISVFALGAGIDEVAPLFEGIEDLPRPGYPDPDALLVGAARQAALGQANHFGAPVPIRNPHVLRKRFSHAFIVVPCALVLMSPLLVSGIAHLGLHLAKQDYQGVLKQYGPLEKRIEEAEQKKKQAQARYDGAVALQRKLANRRKPLYAFIHLAYFFSKYAGRTVRLDSILDKAGTIEIRGIYTDPEDGLSLQSQLTGFAADRGLRIQRNRVAERRDAEGRVMLELELDVDYRELSK